MEGKILSTVGGIYKVYSNGEVYNLFSRGRYDRVFYVDIYRGSPDMHCASCTLCYWSGAESVFQEERVETLKGNNCSHEMAYAFIFWRKCCETKG